MLGVFKKYPATGHYPQVCAIIFIRCLIQFSPTKQYHRDRTGTLCPSLKPYCQDPISCQRLHVFTMLRFQGPVQMYLSDDLFENTVGPNTKMDAATSPYTPPFTQFVKPSENNKQTELNINVLNVKYVLSICLLYANVCCYHG